MELTSQIHPLDIMDFHFPPILATTEESTHYVPGGFHPIIIGDVLGPSPENESRQYRIMHKLGFSSHSTVWLAQKTDSSQAFVALKITMAKDSITMEAPMLIEASKVQTTHLITLLDHFTLHGPNGAHTVLVTDVVVPVQSLLNIQRRVVWYKAAAHSLTQGVVDLHSAGIVHGDLHLGNIGSAIPQIANQDPESVMLELGDHEITIVLPVLSAKRNPSLPAYVLPPCNTLAAYYKMIAGSEALPQTMIFDFGNAHKAGSLPLSFGCTLKSCAPEVAFAQFVEGINNPPIEPPADVWALGTLIYEIVAGYPLFRPGSVLELLHQIVAMVDSLPPTWLNWYSSLANPPEVSPSRADAWWAERRRRLHKHCRDEESVDGLIIFLKKVLVLDPASRPTAAQVLQDPWFLPHTGAKAKPTNIAHL